MLSQYLQIPASSAPIERLFSIAGQVFRPERCSLSNKLFETVRFIRCNNSLLFYCNRSRNHNHDIVNHYKITVIIIKSLCCSRVVIIIIILFS